MMLIICDVCGTRVPGRWWSFAVEGQPRTYVVGGCCFHKPFHVPDRLSMTVTVRRPNGALSVYEVG